MDREVLMHEMTERFQALYGEALDALEKAPDGQWISASEFAFRDAFLTLMAGVGSVFGCVPGMMKSSAVVPNGAA